MNLWKQLNEELKDIEISLVYFKHKTLVRLGKVELEDSYPFRAWMVHSVKFNDSLPEKS